MKKILKIPYMVVESILNGVSSIFIGAPGRVRIDNDIALKIVSSGGNSDTKVMTPKGEEIECVQSIDIHDIDGSSGILHATIVVEVRLG